MPRGCTLSRGAGLPHYAERFTAAGLAAITVD